MNRRERRLAVRRNGSHPGPPPLCLPGTHAFGKITTTVAGEATATYVICKTCRRTFQQVMEQSPGDLRLYRSFLEAERATIKHTHDPDPDGLPVDDCPGCARAAALDHSSPEELT